MGWDTFWYVIWWMIAFFLFVAYLFALWYIIADLFRDHKLSGWWKAVWIVFLIFLPLITALVYLIARGNGMAERQMAADRATKSATDSYIREVAGKAPDPTDQLASARALHESGALTDEEYAQLKAKILS